VSDIDKIFLDIVALKSTDKLVLVDKILASIHPINNGVEKVWEKEADERVEAYNKGYLSTIDDETLFSKYKS
jgi:hypothetical protein